MGTVLAVARSGQGRSGYFLVSGTKNAWDSPGKVHEAVLPPLAQLQQCFVMEAILKLGTGKVDFTGAEQLALSLYRGAGQRIIRRSASTLHEKVSADSRMNREDSTPARIAQLQ